MPLAQTPLRPYCSAIALALLLAAPLANNLHAQTEPPLPEPDEAIVFKLEGSNQAPALTEIQNLRSRKVEIENFAQADRGFYFSLEQFRNDRWRFQRLSDPTQAQWYQNSETILQTFVDAKTDQEIETALRQATQLWNENQKIAFALSLADDWLKDYNDVREETFPTTRTGTVPLLQLIQTARDTTSRNGGVCRDISAGQAVVLEKLGFQDVYLVARDTNSAWHVTLLFRSPSDPQAIYRIDYRNLSKSTDSPAALHTADDLSHHILIARPSGELVASLPSRIQRAYERSLSTPTLEDGPFLNLNRDPLASVTLRHGSRAYTLSTASTIDGTLLILAGSQFWGRGHQPRALDSTTPTPNPHRFQLPGALRLGTIAQQGRGEEVTQAIHAKLRIEQSLITPSLTLIKDHLAVNGSAQVVLDAGLVFARQDELPWDNVDPSLQGELKMTVKARCLKNRLSCDVVTGVVPALGVKDIRNNDFLSDFSNFRIFSNLAYVSTETKYQWKEALQLGIQAVIGLRFTGPQGLFAARVQHQKGWNARAGWQGNLRSDAPQIAPGTQREAFLAAGYRKKLWEVSVTWAVPTTSGSAPMRFQGEIRKAFPTRRVKK